MARLLRTPDKTIEERQHATLVFCSLGAMVVDVRRTPDEPELLRFGSACKQQTSILGCRVAIFSTADDQYGAWELRRMVERSQLTR